MKRWKLWNFIRRSNLWRMTYQFWKRHTRRTSEVELKLERETNVPVRFFFTEFWLLFQRFRRGWIWHKHNWKTAKINWRRQTPRLLTFVKKKSIDKCICISSFFNTNERFMCLFVLVMEVSDLRTQLKKTQREASRAAGKNIKGLFTSTFSWQCFCLHDKSFFIFIICTAGEEYFHLRVIFFFPELEQKLETQERENKKMEIANKGESCRVEHRSLILHLFTNKWKIPSVCPHQIFLPVSELILEVRELKKCCSDNSAHCGGCCSFTALICVDTGLFHTFWRFKKKNSIVLSHRFTKTTSAES